MSRIERKGEYYTQGGAEFLATCIRAFWARKGKSPKIWVEASYDTNGTGLFFVRSDMVGGQPR